MTPNPLADCGPSPNCISSTASDPAKRIAPMTLCAPPPQMMRVLRQILLSLGRTRIVEETPVYLRAECKSLLSFVDDVEFHLDLDHKVLHMRSASRTGFWDLGVNRRRLEHICKELRKRCGGVREEPWTRRDPAKP
ncbi:Uncharacterized conserved protein, DUF1499 family [Desulfacinum infernum DSM 9756]|uniref:Uncharacterized conserved protein, DUF1499 family n=1 Tax=Desulfacinum infernum DSM 9756 TaxID=1121391 RepID=A0A1M5FV26_9BACT|nr:DUF1499 domain-containing protein [Desulfacinum infernum]SHF95254.1 Uncharacterized conserved protein, DUF1499 family [Desulfacinum infernum DSM 9756]